MYWLLHQLLLSTTSTTNPGCSATATSRHVIAAVLRDISLLCECAVPSLEDWLAHAQAPYHRCCHLNTPMQTTHLLDCYTKMLNLLQVLQQLLHVKGFLAKTVDWSIDALAVMCKPGQTFCLDLRQHISKCNTC